MYVVMYIQYKYIPSVCKNLSDLALGPRYLLLPHFVIPLLPSRVGSGDKKRAYVGTQEKSDNLT